MDMNKNHQMFVVGAINPAIRSLHCPASQKINKQHLQFTFDMSNHILEEITLPVLKAGKTHTQHGSVGLAAGG